LSVADLREDYNLEFEDIPIFIYGSISAHFFSKTNSGQYFDYVVAAKQITGEPPMIFEPIKKIYNSDRDKAAFIKEEYY
jgi:hypothetical protein